MMYGGGGDREVICQESGPGTGDAIYTTRSGRRFCGTYGQLPNGFYWSRQRYSVTQTVRVTYTKNREEIVEEIAEEDRALFRRGARWWMVFQAAHTYKPRFRRFQSLTRPVNRARSNPIHVRNRPWDPRERA